MAHQRRSRTCRMLPGLVPRRVLLPPFWARFTGRPPPSPLGARGARRGAAQVAVGGWVGIQGAYLADGERDAGVLGAREALRGSPVAGPQLEAPAGHLRQSAGTVDLTPVQAHGPASASLDRGSDVRCEARAGRRPLTVFSLRWVRFMSAPPPSP